MDRPVQAIAPVMTVFLFLSSVNFPRNLITADWFRWVATVNPLSYMVEGLRSVLVTGWDVTAIGLFAFTSVLFVVTMIGAAFALRRLART